MINIYQVVLRLMFLLIAIVFFLAMFMESLYPELSCKLCMYQRVSYLFCMMLAAVGIYVNVLQKTISVVLNLVLFMICGISMTQVLMEYHLIDTSFACQSIDASNIDTIEEYKKRLVTAELVSCDQPAFILFETSLAGYSMILSGNFAVFMAFFNITQKFFRYERKEATS